jgi:hypothetical protein
MACFERPHESPDIAQGAPMTDLSLVPTKDLMRALADRCEAIVLLMYRRLDTGKVEEEWFMNGENMTCRGAASTLVFRVLTHNAEEKPR